VGRKEKLNEQQQERLAVLMKPHPELAVARRFMDEFYGLFNGKPRPSTAKSRWQLMIARPEYAASPILKRALKILKDEVKFNKVSLYLNFRNLDSTSNEVERDNRGFRKRQKTHYRFRDKASLEALLKRGLVEAGAPTKRERLTRRFGNPNWIKAQAA